MNIEQPTSIENAESTKDKVEKLEQVLSQDLNSEVNLYYNPYSRNYGIGYTDMTKGSMIIEPGTDSEAASLLTDIYNKYQASIPLGEIATYREPGNDAKTNSTTDETRKAASFTLKDFLEDMKNLEN